MVLKCSIPLGMVPILLKSGFSSMSRPAFVLPIVDPFSIILVFFFFFSPGKKKKQLLFHPFHILLFSESIII